MLIRLDKFFRNAIKSFCPKRHWEKCPIEEKSFFSFITYFWLDRFIYSKSNTLLNVHDLPPIPTYLKSNHTWEKFRGKWKPCFPNQSEYDDVTKQTTLRSLGCSLILSFRRLILFSTVLRIIYDLLSLTPTLFLDLLIRYIADGESEWWEGHLYSFLFFMSLFLSKMFYEAFILSTDIVAVQVKSSLCNAIYRKIMAMSNSSKNSITSGEMLNLMSVDTDKVCNFVENFILLFSCPLTVVIIFILLWHYMGPSSLAALAVIAVILAASFPVAKKSSSFHAKRMKVKDTRLKHMKEILSGIKIIKFNAWEIPFMDKVSGVREKEVKLIKSFMYCNFLAIFLWTCIPTMISLACFVTYLFVDEKKSLSPRIVFASLNLIRILQYTVFEIPIIISSVIQFRISINRIQNFLLNEERDESTVGDHPEPGAVLSFRNVDLTWERKNAPVLNHINFNVPRGTLVAVIGPVGSGKSSLLSAILGDLHKISGSINLKGTIAYVPQEAWILNRTVKENIIFGKEVHSDKYEKVLEYCCLMPDLNLLPAGDKTEIGEKGINLSGGQKQRVSLARAVLQDADIYLLDDPLSAVDAHVGKRLFEDVIGNKGLLKDKTRILVTHQVSILPYVDLIILMKDGKIEEISKYEGLHLNEDFLQGKIEAHTKLETSKEKSKAEVNNRSRCLTNNFISKEYEPSTTSQKLSFFKTNSLESINGSNLGKLIEKEKMEIGVVNRKAYIDYMRHIGSSIYAPALFFHICYYIFLICIDVWLAKWSNDIALPDGTQDISLRNYRTAIFAGLALISVLTCILQNILIPTGISKSCSKYHQLMLLSVMKSPMSFFDTTPIGRIVNRFSNDLEVIDCQIPLQFNSFLNCSLFLIGTVLVIGISMPMFLIFFIPIAFLFFFVQKLFLMTTLQIKRLDSITRSSIHSSFQETIQSVSSIRAYNVEERFIKDFEENLDKNFTCSFNLDLCNRWLAVRLNFLNQFIILVLLLIAIENRNTMGATILGLVLLFALSASNCLHYYIKCCSELDIQSISLERTKEYCSLPSEAAWHIPEQELPPSWPNNGVINFKDYATRYRKGLELTLKELNLEISANEKIGLVGRTGSGKTSLTLALLRLIEAAEGSIIVDCVDISKIGLLSLRSRLTIIPQEPVLFCGSLRSNLDPHSEYTDHALWSSLERAHLKAFITSLPDGLNFEIAEGGDNLSVGQKQLVCLARALLKKSKILILDEATAAIDMDTDALIQETIREEFKDHTVITIAHRINTIMDYDRVAVMDCGGIKEIGKPSDLLEDSSSRFYSLAKEAYSL